jgi:phosphoglycerate dehydrogenase-like enzyme
LQAATKELVRMVRAAILDDYQNVALKFADWSAIAKDVQVKVFNAPLGDDNAVIKTLQGFAIVNMMRERTPFNRKVIEGLPDLKLLITTGARNNSIDLKACAEFGVTVCGTAGFGNPTAAIAVGLMLELTRHIGFENARMKAGAPWQVTVGHDLDGKTLGVLGLGKLGQRVAGVAKSLGMKVIGWSQNLTPEKAKESGTEYVSKEDLFRNADVISIHVVLSDRTRGLVRAKDLGLMKKTAYLINTSRGPIVEEKALIAALNSKSIAGAGLDVFDIEPLPTDHPFRKMDNVVLTPHLGYVSEENYRTFYSGVVEDIRAWLDGKPVRMLTAK